MLHREIMDVYYVNPMKPKSVLRGQNAVFIVKPGDIYKTGNVRVT